MAAVERRLVVGDSPCEPGEWVQLRCPRCSWRSTESLVLDQVNGTWHAYSAITGQWLSHWRNEHVPAPERWVVPKPGSQ